MRTDRYITALTDVSERCRDLLAEHLDVGLPPISFELSRCAVGSERVYTDYVDTVVFELSSPNQLEPPPVGFTCLYGTCHEIGHLTVARLCPNRLPPVVWDEALAHHIATWLLLPGIAGPDGSPPWPDPYPDFIERETSMLSAVDGSPLSHYDASLLQLDRRLTWLRERVGWDGLADAVRRIRPEDQRAHLFGPALDQAARVRC